MLSFIFLDKFLVKILLPINNTLSMKFVIEVVGGGFVCWWYWLECHSSQIGSCIHHIFLFLHTSYFFYFFMARSCEPGSCKNIGRCVTFSEKNENCTKYLPIVHICICIKFWYWFTQTLRLCVAKVWSKSKLFAQFLWQILCLGFCPCLYTGLLWLGIALELKN